MFRAGVRWRAVLWTGIVVGVLPQLLLAPIAYAYVTAYYLFDLGLDPGWFGNMLGVWGLPALQALLTFLTAFWVTRGARAAAVAHGLLVTLVSLPVGQIAGLYWGPLDASEISRYLVLALAGGLLGGLRASTTVSTGEEALHEASRQVGAARGGQAIANAIGDNPMGPTASGVALWWFRGPGRDGATEPRRSPWFSKGWPDGLRLGWADALLAGPEKPPPRTLRLGEIPAPERAAWRKLGVRSVLLVPLAAPGGAEVGLLAVACSEGRFFRSVARSYGTVGAQAALALENMRLVEEADRAGREAGTLRERQRMAHEIHDTLAQGFNSVVTNLQAAEGIQGADPDRARRHLARAKLTARESLTEARRLVWALRPEALEGASLPEALGKLTRRWSEESGIPAGVAADGDERPLPAAVEATLYRVAQEALNNALKHAKGASRVALTLTYIGDTVVLDARDDGPGFDPARAASDAGEKEGSPSGGFGLKGMRERIEGAGGKLSVESAIGEGTNISVELPVTAPVPSQGTRRHEEGTA